MSHISMERLSLTMAHENIILIQSHTQDQSKEFRINIFIDIFHWTHRPGRSQGLLYKHLCYQLINSFIDSFINDPFPPTALRRRHAQTVRDSSSSYKTDYVFVIKNCPNPKGHQDCISGSKVRALLLKRWILPIMGVALGRVNTLKMQHLNYSNDISKCNGLHYIKYPRKDIFW